MSQQQQTGLKHRARFLIHVLEAEKEVCKMCHCSVCIVVLQLWAETRKVDSNPDYCNLCLAAPEPNWLFGLRKKQTMNEKNPNKPHDITVSSPQSRDWAPIWRSQDLLGGRLCLLPARGLAQRGERTRSLTKRILCPQCHLATADSSGITTARWCSCAPVTTRLQDN